MPAMLAIIVYADNKNQNECLYFRLDDEYGVVRHQI